jgi:hypothetical protein
VVKLRLKRPLSWVCDPRLLAPLGTLRNLTLWGSLPRQRHVTVVPAETVLVFGLKKSSFTETEVRLLAVPCGLPRPPDAGEARSTAASARTDAASKKRFTLSLWAAARS